MMENTQMFENASQAVEWIIGLRYAGEKHGLENMRALLDELDHPETGLKYIHVAGTNGKGSTCAMLERMLRENGYKIGLYTSPYLMRFPERIRVNGIPIGDEALVRHANRVRACAERLVQRDIKPTTFELITAVAMCCFAEESVDIAVIEVGLGGRFDSTNFILPEVALIAPIGFDHMKQLGNTLAEIAFEKAGIIKPGVPVVIAPQFDEAREVLHRACAERGAPLTDLADLPPTIEWERVQGSAFLWEGFHAEIGLAGRHQIENATLALTGTRLLIEAGWAIDMEKTVAGLKKARWPGRVEWLDDQLLIDGAHNPHGARALVEYAKVHFKDREIVLVLGMMRGKAVEECMAIFAEVANRAIATRIDYPRAATTEQLYEALVACGITAYVDEDIFRAIQTARAMAGEDGVVIVCGSLYLVGDVRLKLKDDGGVL